MATTSQHPRSSSVSGGRSRHQSPRDDYGLRDLSNARDDVSFDTPAGWVLTSLEFVCTSVTDGDHLPPPKTAQGIPLLVIGNVRNRQLDFTACRYVSPDYFAALDSIRKPQKGDILYTLVGSFGIPVLVREDRPFCVQRHVAILRPSKLVSVRFLVHALSSGFVFDQASACATGIAQKTVLLRGLRRIRIPVPPFAEQQRIVAKVDKLMAMCDQLETQLTTAQSTSRRLLEAVLHKALAAA